MTKPAHTPRQRTFLLALLLILPLFALAIGGCGKEEAPPAPDYEKALADSPPALAAIHEQANELLPGGKEAFEARIEELGGFPAVVNVWASWCGPCRAEFPHLQQAGAKLGREVAFLGVDTEDDADAAKTFLESMPVPYPSYSDPDKEISSSLGAVHGYPATAFFDENGEQTYINHGPYTSEEQLEEDIRTYAINGGEG